MKTRYDLLIEAIAEWFMQLFFDPMYHCVTVAPEVDEPITVQVSILKDEVSCIEKKGQIFVRELFNACCRLAVYMGVSAEKKGSVLKRLWQTLTSVTDLLLLIRKVPRYSIQDSSF